MTRDTHRPRSGSARQAALGALVLAAGAAAAWVALRGSTTTAPSEVPRATPPPPDPRVTYTGPYRNVDPRVAAVGDAACAECHAEIAAKFAAHPMGRSLVPIAAV